MLMDLQLVSHIVLSIVKDYSEHEKAGAMRTLVLSSRVVKKTCHTKTAEAPHSHLCPAYERTMADTGSGPSILADINGRLR